MALKEIISIYSLGLKTKSLVKAILFFSFLILFISIFFNFYISPKIYKEYKIKEFEIRNKIDFAKIVISNSVATAFTSGGPNIIHAISPIKKSLNNKNVNLVFLFELASLLRTDVGMLINQSIHYISITLKDLYHR